jgi:predicted PhzF superfamily epimerase YddE/YHI9
MGRGNPADYAVGERTAAAMAQLGKVNAMPFPVSIVNACLRDGRGGSPTAVVDDSAAATMTDAERSRVPVHFGTSHAVFVTSQDPEHKDTVDLSFFTAEGTLPACGHGTVAALAFLAEQREAAGLRQAAGQREAAGLRQAAGQREAAGQRVAAGQRQGAEHEFELRVSGRTFTGRTVRDGDLIHAVFDPGPVTLRDPTPAEADLVVAALGLNPDLLTPGACVASLGRARMLVPVATSQAVATLAPDLDRLRAACDRLGLLGCYVHSAPTSAGRVTARMFAPSIGVPEDIANANSTACIVAHLAGRGVTELSVDMGDALGSPATITAAVQQSPTGSKIVVGGAATIAR